MYNHDDGADARLRPMRRSATMAARRYDGATEQSQNTVDLVSLDPTRNDGGSRTSVAGDPFTDTLIGPTNGCWGRLPGESGRVAYVLTDGGTKTAPLDGIAREAAVLRMDFGT